MTSLHDGRWNGVAASWWHTKLVYSSSRMPISARQQAAPLAPLIAGLERVTV
jgi:hypothetical protein